MHIAISEENGFLSDASVLFAIWFQETPQNRSGHKGRMAQRENSEVLEGISGVSLK